MVNQEKEFDYEDLLRQRNQLLQSVSADINHLIADYNNFISIETKLLDYLLSKHVNSDCIKPT